MKILKEGRSATFEYAVADKLENPREAENAKGDLVRWVCSHGCKVLGVCGSAKEDRRYDGPGHWFEEDVEDGIIECHYSAQIKVEVGDRGPLWQGNDCGGVGELRRRCELGSRTLRNSGSSTYKEDE